jgi:hypothetical protein
MNEDFNVKAISSFIYDSFLPFWLLVGLFLHVSLSKRSLHFTYALRVLGTRGVPVG